MTATTQSISISAASAQIAVTTTATTAIKLPFKKSTVRVINKGSGYIYVCVATTPTLATVAPTVTATNQLWSNTSAGVLAGSDVGFSLDGVNDQYISIIGDASSTAHIHIDDGN